MKVQKEIKTTKNNFLAGFVKKENNNELANS